MNIKKELIGSTLTTTIGVTFVASPFTPALTQVEEMPCFGANSCKDKNNAKGKMRTKSV